MAWMFVAKNGKNMGEKTWLIQGFLWSLCHCFWKWNLLIIAPSAFYFLLLLKKYLDRIIVHGTMNFIPVIVLILGVF